MKNICIVLVHLTLAFAASEDLDIRVRWARQQNDPHRISSLFELPPTKNDALSAGWVEAKDANSTIASVFCLKDDPRVCALYDARRSIAGLMISFLVSDVQSTDGYDYSQIGAYRRGNVLGYDVWTATIHIKNPKITRVGDCGTVSNITEAVGMWIKTTDGYQEIPKLEKDLNSDWVKQICVSEQGVHYFYKLSPRQSCKDFWPWFLLYDKGQLVGGGIAGFGRISKAIREWFELLGVSIKVVVPDGPKCLSDWIDKYGLIFTHFFLIREPWYAKCCL